MWILATILVLGFSVNDASAQHGTVLNRADGSWGYLVSPLDNLGQWDVALGRPFLWTELVSVNPQLSDPDLIHPGQEINLTSEVAAAILLWQAEHLIAVPSSTTSPITSAGATTSPVTEAVISSTPEWPFGSLVSIACLLVVIIILAVLWLLSDRRRQHEADEMLRIERESHQREAAEREAREAEERRANPFSGPPVVPGGLPDIESATRYIAQRYQRERNGLTVAESAARAAHVSILRMRPVWVQGPMLVGYDGGVFEERDIPRTAAWEATLSDGTVTYTLMGCGNPIYAGRRMNRLPATQVTPREDIPAREVDVPIWPVETTDEPAVEEAENVPLYANARFDGPHRLVMHRLGERGNPRTLDSDVLPGLVMSIVDGTEIIASWNGARQIVGRIADPMVTEPSEDGAEAPKPETATV
jgi:hypothetical protein